MTANDYLVLFGLLVVFFGIGLLLYTQLLGLILRFHLILFPKIHSKILLLENSKKEITPKCQHELFPSEYEELHSLILEWERSVYGGTNCIEQLRNEKEVTDWESRVIEIQGRIKAFAYCSCQLRKSLSLPKKFPEQFFESGKE